MKESIVSRTFKCAKVNCLKVDVESRRVNEITEVIDSKYDTIEKAESYFRKYDSKVVAVLGVEIVESLLGMTEKDFIKHGTMFNERSKENRNMISKEVTFKHCKVLAVDKERKIVETMLVGIDNEKQARNACKDNGLLFVEIEEIIADKQLICMDKATFISNASPMKDRFTLA